MRLTPRVTDGEYQLRHTMAAVACLLAPRKGSAKSQGAQYIPWRCRVRAACRAGSGRRPGRHECAPAELEEGVRRRWSGDDHIAGVTCIRKYLPDEVASSQSITY